MALKKNPLMLGFKSGALDPRLKTAAVHAGSYMTQNEEEGAKLLDEPQAPSADLCRPPLCQISKEGTLTTEQGLVSNFSHQHLDMLTVLPGQLSYKQRGIISLPREEFPEPRRLTQFLFIKMWENISFFCPIFFFIAPYSVRL